MTWTAETSRGFEQDKIAHLVVPYLQGRCLDLGCGKRKVWPTLIGVDRGGAADVIGDIGDLAMFADASMDGVFSSHALEDFPREQVPTVLREWRRVLKTGGHLVLYVPSANLYPKVGEPGANRDHQWDIYPGDIEAMLRDIGGWELLESEERGATNEYGLFIVARKIVTGWVENVWQRNPGGKKRALVIRYGAIGDQIQAASVLPGLRKQDYHVTYNTTPGAHDVVLHDPHIDEFMVQAKDFVPNEQLGSYWAALAERYDKIVNMCESVEGALLTLPGRVMHGYSDAVRQKLLGGTNYLERMHDIAEIPHDFAPYFYPTDAEHEWAHELRRGMNGPVVLWAISGSSLHKIYPFTQIVANWLLDKTGAHLMLSSDGDNGKLLQDGIVESAGLTDHPRLHAMAGKWTIRETLTMAQHVDCVVGPETGVLNGVCFEAVPKVIYLSHSSPTNLTKHWLNTVTLTPDRKQAPCYPCHRLHGGWEYCHRSTETAAALCASAVSPEAVFEAIAGAIGMRRAA